ITNCKYGRLTAIRYAGSVNNSDSLWACKCDCGVEVVVRLSCLTMKRTQSCGCLRRDDISGQKFNRLTAIKFVGVNTRQQALWECLCECGNNCIVLATNLRKGNTRSCGCFKLDMLLKRS